MSRGSSWVGALCVGVVLVAALAVSACSKAAPTGPTPVSQIGATATPEAIVTAVGAGRGGGVIASPLTISWECFASAATRPLGRSGDCPTQRWSAQDGSVDAIVTSAPTNLQRVVQGSSVTLTWGTPPGNAPTSYVIEAGSASGSSNLAVFDTGSTATSMTVNGVPAGSYFVRVRGRDGSGNGPVSNEVVVVVQNGTGPGPGGGCAGPGTPSNLVATVIGSAVALTWRAPTSGCEISNYLVVVGSSPGMNNLAVVNTGNEATSFTVATAPLGTFYIRVRGASGATLGAFSNEVQATVTGIAPPGTTIWTGLVANGDGVTILDDDDCGQLKLDITGRFVQSGSSVSGLLTITIRNEGTCSGAIGFTDSSTIVATATGSLAIGSGTLSGTSSNGTDSDTFSGSFSNGRMTGTFNSADGTVGTFSMNRQP